MKLARLVTALLLSAALPVPAFAQPHVIAELGTAPLIGQIASTPALQSDVRSQRRLFETAGVKLGLSSREYAQFASRIASRQLTYVTIPRHLDAMSWSSGGRVYVLHDVIVPAGTKGWEVDLREGHELVALFIPARCGNLSVVRRALPALAQRPPVRRPAAVAAADYTAPASPAPTPVPVQPAVAVALPAAAAPTPAPYAAVATSTPAVHRARLWPLLLIPVIAFLVSNHHAGPGPVIGTTTAAAPPPLPPAATPPPASCSTPPPQ